MPDFVAPALSKSSVSIGQSAKNGGIPRAMEWSLYDMRGRRKYLVAQERWAFLRTALDAGGPVATFCAVLTLSGARISEVLALTPDRVDRASGTIVFETLKRRRPGVIRAVPVPYELFTLLETVHPVVAVKSDSSRALMRLWPWSRTTAWRRVKDVMRQAGQSGHVAQPKALRHAFGAAATLERISPLILQKWMGHARIETTQIYATLTGPEERTLAKATWKGAERLLRDRRAISHSADVA